MGFSPRTCPKCHASLASIPAHNGKLRCPKCGVLLSYRRPNDQLQTTPRASLSGGDGEETPNTTPEASSDVPQKSGALLVVLTLLGLGLSLLVLLVLGGGLAAYWYFSQTATPTTVASVPDEATQPAAPVVQLHPEPAKEPIQAAQPVKAEAGGGHDTLPLKELKDATVFIRVETPKLVGSGSGFVVHAEGAIVYVATNHHVISPPADLEKADPPPPSPGQRTPGTPLPPRPPFNPRLPFVPRVPRRRMAQVTPSNSNVAKITVVFNSGTAKEQALSATVVGDDAVHDLAILRLVGVTTAPQPINYRWPPELRETMPVVMFGFPLGRLLDQKKKYPAITVTNGRVSSLRGAGTEIDDVQLNIDMNPGNSGGPVVDEKGVLIGVAYAGWKNTNINFAIPVPKLTSLLQGRIDPPTALESSRVGGRQQIRVHAPASDPLGKLRSPTLHYGLATEVRMPPKRNGNSWPPLAGAKSSALTLEGIQTTATLDLTPPAGGQFQVIAQVSYQKATGQMVYGEPRVLSLGATKPPPAVAGPTQPVKPAPPTTPAVAPRPSKTPTGEELTKLVADLKSSDEAIRERAASILQQTQALKGMDAKAAEKAVLPLLADRNVFVRCAAVKMLADVGGSDSIVPLEKLAQENNFFHSGLARQILASLKNGIDQTTPPPKIDASSSAVKTPGLLAYWSFEEGEGERAADASGNGLHAKLVHAGWTEGIRGKSLRLTGKGSYLDFGGSSRLSFAARAPFTIAFWTRTTRSKGTLFSQRNSRNGGALIDILIAEGKAKAQVRQDGNDIMGPTEVSSGTINDGNWHHLALIREGDSIELFLDGVSQGRKSGSSCGGAITTDLRALGAERYWFNHFAFGDPHFEGDMDEFCILERVLTAKEVAALALR